MNGGPLFDEDLIRRLPLPLAQLYRRADNAVEPLKRHLAAFDLWEAALMLLSSTAIVEYAGQAEIDPALADELKALARPQLGQWWRFARLLLPVLAKRGDQPFAQLEAALLGPTRDDLPRVAGLDAAVLDVLGKKKKGAQAAVRLQDLFDHLVTYRNKVIGHAAPGQLADELNERMARTLLSGLSQLLGRLDFLAGRRLLYVASVRPEAGRWIVDRFELRGENARHLDPLEIPRTARDHMPVDGKRLYLEAPAATQDPGSAQELARMRLLHPLVTYEPQEQQVFFLCGRPSEKRTDYLCFMTGRHDERPDLGSEQRELLARVLKMPVDDAQLNQWAGSPAEEPEAETEQATPAKGPRTIGEFQLLSKLGEGGMGVVYRAWQPSLRRQVALKVLSGMGEKAEARFNREIQALGRVDHRHVVKVFTSGSEGEFWFYAMELVEGVPLSMVCERLQAKTTSAAQVDLQTWQGALSTACAESRKSEKPLSSPPAPPRAVPIVSPEADHSPPLPGGRDYVRQIVRLIAQAAEGAHALHEANVIHRDIKPGNIMVTADGKQAMLLDLGVAQLADDLDGKLTRTRQVVGTLRYASPQQVLAVGKLDRRTDIYSLGVTLWELLTLRAFLDATDDTPEPVLMEKIQHEEPKRMRAYHPRIPRDLEAIVQKCLEKDPKRRYATAADLAADLNRFLNREAVVARPVGMLRRGYRRAKRRPIRALAAAATCAALVLAAFAYRYWDAHYRTKIEYYGRFIMQHGAPVGLGRIDEAQSHRRGVTWKFVKRGDRVERFEAVNGLGYPTTEHSEEAFIHRTGEVKRECGFQYRRDADGNVQEEIAVDRRGQPVWIFHFSTPTTGYYADKRGYPRARGGSGAAFVEFVYNDAGFEWETRYLDKDANPQPNNDGVFGYRMDRDDRGLAIKGTVLDSTGKATLCREGYAGWNCKYDDRGNRTELVYFDLAGKPVVTRGSYAGWQNTYDEQGNEIEGVYLGPDGRPAAIKNGYSKWTYSYDDRGNQIGKAYIGVDGKPATHKDGNARVASTFDDEGNEIKRAFFGLDGNPVAIINGYAGWTALYDDQGNQTQKAYFNIKGKPALHKDGNAKLTTTFDDRGNEIARTFFGRDGKPVAIKDGYASWTALYDDQGNLTERAYFGADGKPTICNDGYARSVRKFDDRGNGIETAFFGVDGKPTLHRLGHALETAKYDDHGNQIDVTLFGLDGKPVAINIGAARVAMKYDNRGNKIQTEAFGPDGSPIAVTNGFAKSVAQYDDRGNEIETEYFGVDGRRTLTNDGFAKRIRRFDERGNEIELAVFGLDDKPIACKDGYATAVWKYDAHGNQTESAFFGVDGRPTMYRDGYAKRIAKYDDRGNITERAYFGLRGEPVLENDGYAKLISKYDERSNEIEAQVLGFDDKPVAGKDGYSLLRCDYNDRGNRIRAAYYGVNGQPALEKDGDAGWTARYDTRGNQVERSFFGFDGKPRAIKAGYAKVTRDYDNRGNEIATAYFSAEGRPARDSNGCIRITKSYDSRGIRIADVRFGLDGKQGYTVLSRKYDTRGNLLEEAYFDDDSKPVLHKDGYTKAVARYDDHGNGIELAYFGPDGKPAFHKDGYSKWRAKYDDRGNKTELVLFGLNDELVFSKLGYAKVTAKRDRHGNMIEEAYFGLGGKPVRGPRGFSKAITVYDEKANRIAGTWWDSEGYPMLARRYDAKGRIIEESYADANGKPMAGREGFAAARAHYDGHGNRVELDYLGTDGKPAPHKDGNAKWTAKYDDHGNMIEEVYYGLDDKPVRLKLGYAKLTALYDKSGNQIKRSYFEADGSLKTVHVLADEIQPGSQALKIGIQRGDVLERYDGKPVTDMSSFIYGRQFERSGDKPRELQLLRRGSIVKVSVSSGRLGLTLRDDCSAATINPQKETQRHPLKDVIKDPVKTPVKDTTKNPATNSTNPSKEKPSAAVHAATK